MTLPQSELMLETIDCLMAVSGTAIAPSDAAKRLHLIEVRYPRAKLELVWEEMGTDELFHYDALLHFPEAGTLSLGFCRSQSLPWLVRSARRWNDADLVRVGETVLKVDQAIAHFDFLSEANGLADRLVDVCLVQEELNRHPVEVSDAELQRAMDGFRRAHRLYTTAATHRWMETRGIAHADLERLVAEHAALASLRERLTASQMRGFFERHHAEFDIAHIAQIHFLQRSSAQQTHLDIQAGAVGFLEAAEAQFLQHTGCGSAEPRNFFQSLRRGLKPTPLSLAAFEAAPGELLSPIDSDDGSIVARVLSFTEARLDGSTQGLIQQLLFDDWLEQQRQSADIEWCRGRGKGQPATPP